MHAYCGRAHQKMIAMVLLVVGLDCYDGAWQGVWADGYIPTLSSLRARAVEADAQELVGARPSDTRERDALFTLLMDDEWWTHSNDLAGVELPYYLAFGGEHQSQYTAIQQEFQRDDRGDDYRAMIAVRRSSTSAWEESLARYSLARSGFELKEGGYLDRDALNWEARRLLYDVMSFWVYPCFHARNSLIKLGFQADYVEGYDPDRGIVEPWVEDHSESSRITHVGNSGLRR